MGEEGEVNSAIEGDCQVCAQQVAKYRCPACSVQSCSLPCLRLHKERTACTGKRVRATRTFMPASKLTEEILLDDQLLLDKASSCIKESSSPLPVAASTRVSRGPPRRLLEFQRRCRERRINLALMPPGMARSQNNRSRVLAGNRLLWTIEWIVLDGPTPEHPIYMRLDDLNSFTRCHKYTMALETDNVATAYDKLLPDTLLPKDITSVQLFIKLEADRPQSPGQYHSQSQDRSQEESSSQFPTQGFDVSPSKRLWPIHSPQVSLNLLLTTRTIIEFPTIYIYLENSRP